MLKRCTLLSILIAIVGCGSSDRDDTPIKTTSPYDNVAFITNTVAWPYNATTYGTDTFKLGDAENADTIILQNIKSNGLKFPSDFAFGVAGSAYQYEGNRQAPTLANPDGVGWSIWDVFSEKGSWLNPKGTNIEELAPTDLYTQPNGSVAIKGFEREYYLEDIQKAADLGVKTYRLSISWPRLFPHEGMDAPDEAGMTYYINVIEAIKAAGLTPLITLYHWDLPTWLYNFGDRTVTNEADRRYGWLDMRDAKDNTTLKEFQTYTAAVYQRLGQYTPYFSTFNEPLVFTNNAFTIGSHAPGKNGYEHLQKVNGELYGYTADENALRLPYLQAINVIKAHDIAYRTIHAIYNNNRAAYPKPMVSIVMSSDWAEPFRIECSQSNSPNDQCHYHPDDVAASQRQMEFSLGWWLDPVMFGRWPDSMNDIYTKRISTTAQPLLGQFEDSSCLQSDGKPVACGGANSLRLTDDIRRGGTLDLVSINHYTGSLVVDTAYAQANYGATAAQGTVPTNQYGGTPFTIPVGWESDVNVFNTQFRYYKLGGDTNSATPAAGNAYVIGNAGSKPWLRQTWFVYRKLMQYVNHNYMKGKPGYKTKSGIAFPDLEMYLTENGTSVLNESQESAVGNNQCDPSLNKKLCDPNRIEYMIGNIGAIQEARVLDNINIKLYTYWSIADNFEWNDAYNSRFGLVWINYDTFNRELKQSYYCFQSIIAGQGPAQLANNCPLESTLN